MRSTADMFENELVRMSCCPKQLDAQMHMCRRSGWAEPAYTRRAVQTRAAAGCDIGRS